jgi:stage V sporulation protein AC
MGKDSAMKMTNEEYKRYAERRAPRSQTGGNMLRAFLYGGAICCVGQALLNLYTALGLDAETAGTACSITLVFLGAALTAAGVYDDIAKRAGAGTLVPITGFANSVAAPALEFKTEGFITGTAAKMFVIAGPVVVYGASAGVVYGLLLLLLHIV